MTRFAVVNAKLRTVDFLNYQDLPLAQTMAELPKGIDHGLVARRLSVVVWEYGLFQPPAETAYFTINGKLYAGNGVLYAFDEMGDTVDVEAIPTVEFLTGGQAIAAVDAGIIDRPQTSVNGKVLWRWPEPPPDWARAKMKPN